MPQAPQMSEIVAQLWPEIALFVTACLVMVVGLSKDRTVRGLCAPLCGLGLLVAGYLAITTSVPTATSLPFMAQYGKALAAGVGLLLLMLMSGTADRGLEALLGRGEAGTGSKQPGSIQPGSIQPGSIQPGPNKGSGRFEPMRSVRAEFYSFFLFSLMGLMLCSGSHDLIFLFLALELTSLPTYVMVSLSTRRDRSMEAGVKYFFLGAMGAAMFLFGFALVYGATGSTSLSEIGFVLQSRAAETGSIGPLATIGLAMSLLGVMFKIAAVPMHFYTADVYQGASSSVTAFLAFVPKSAGFFAIMLLAGCAGWTYGPGGYGTGNSLPSELRTLLWTVAVLTMTVGNVLALLQTSVKRILAYSSIAHSGYMLVGVIAGPGVASAVLGTGVGESSLASNGLAAVLFYLLTYGVMSVGTFSVIASLERQRTRRSGDGAADGLVDGLMETEEVDHIDEMRGLWKRQPLLAAVMVVCAFGLLGLPPLLGFLGKLPLFTSALGAGEITLVVILGLNSAVAACYYLRLVAVPFLDSGEPATPGLIGMVPFPSRALAGVVAAVLVIVAGLAGGMLGKEAARGGTFVPASRTMQAERSGTAQPGAMGDGLTSVEGGR